MGKETRSGKSWTLTDVAFSRLLVWLATDQERAVEKYLRLREKLCIFFEHRGCPYPEELTDKTLDRVARKLAAGEEIEVSEPASYCYGIAHNILKEYWREPSRNSVSLDSQLSASDSYLAVANKSDALVDDKEQEFNFRHLEFCLSKLSPEDRELILAYYDGDHRDRINNRQQLSLKLGIPPGTLRIRALRIREQLYDCMIRCNRLHGEW
ncbi:MAG: sigma-70 family RNA polymerase sigma factor [Acidobacteria bacterium]|nr:sigma-70 family RNA polymerase sigma factor [Acidobacteriota bacterium]